MSLVNAILESILRLSNITSLKYQPYPESCLQTSAMFSFAVKLRLSIFVLTHQGRNGIPIKSRSGTDDNIA
jgi:hypothetical protein